MHRAALHGDAFKLSGALRQHDIAAYILHAVHGNAYVLGVVIDVAETHGHGVGPLEAHFVCAVAVALPGILHSLCHHIHRHVGNAPAVLALHHAGHTAQSSLRQDGYMAHDKHQHD